MARTYQPTALMGYRAFQPAGGSPGYTKGERYPAGNAASIGIDANNIGPWTQLPSAAITTSATRDDGNWSIRLVSVTINSGMYIDLYDYCRKGKEFALNMRVRHWGSGDPYGAYLSPQVPSITGATTWFTRSSGQTAWTSPTTLVFTLSDSTRYFMFREVPGGATNGGLYIDAISIFG